MKPLSTTIILGVAVFPLLVSSQMLSAQTFTEALTGGETDLVFRLRYEGVSQDNALQDAKALTLRSTIQYTTGAFEGFSAGIQLEDIRIVGGVNEYSVPPTDFNTGIYSVIADPETTELSQGFIQYKNDEFSGKFGRQIITYDNQRFIGKVGWRQDWQVYDAFSAGYDSGDKINVNYNYLTQRKRIFADAADVDSDDHLINASYASPFGSLVAYAYLLEVDQVVSNSLDTYGLRLTGSKKLGELDTSYLAEYATQDSENGSAIFSADYYVFEGALNFSAITTKLGYEVLGSDKGFYGFSTPLATGHAFNGWADMFLSTPAQGLTDFYLNLSGKILGGTLTAVYHDFEADKSSLASKDMGSEIDFQYTRLFAEHYTVGLNYANYSTGNLTSNPDTEKFWLWFQASF